MESKYEGKIEVVQVLENNQKILAEFDEDGEEVFKEMNYLLFDKNGNLHGQYFYNGDFYIADQQDNFSRYIMFEDIEKDK
jgi:CMP-N-acetylneuraminic acid synthetase